MRVQKKDSGKSSNSDCKVTNWATCLSASVLDHSMLREDPCLRESLMQAGGKDEALISGKALPINANSHRLSCGYSQL